ncbi:hypothetical protein HanHA300_Chr11g0390081 [Helianthus annuus]|nr:hypothetical protein HanHA300_Chr11g0390081 [Helianthus annuus]KAJ0684366.1 hypothetical protein HanLR1_Chr11g0390421 [Helianthus annuus]KAJ0688306.1 hypothetical protein HanOQP8_Chr11g0392891 [Helianthus annuus]
MVNRIISKKDTRDRPKINFMTVVGTKIRKTLTAKDTKKCVIWFTVEENLKRRFFTSDSRR